MSESALPGSGGLSLPWPVGGSEERLARRAAAGDERAFTAIFRRYGPELHRYCLAIVGNGADAQDALQNVMVKALRSLPGERREIKLKPWLYRVAHNESVELLRQRQGERLDPEAAAPGAGLAETAAQRQRLRHLLADLGQLPERQRGALLMRELAGLDFEQIGAALGVSAATARQTAYEARLGLHEMEAGREMTCDAVTKAISDGDGRVLRRRDVRAHLRSCAECRAFRAAIDDRRRDLAAIGPLPAVAVAALLKGALGGTSVGVGGGAAAGGAAMGGIGAAGSTVAVKAAATLAVVAAIGAGAADRAGLVHIGDPGDGKSAAQQVGGGAHPLRASETAAANGSPASRAAAIGAGEAARARVEREGTPGSAIPGVTLGPAAGQHRGNGGKPGGLQLGKGHGGSGPPAHSHAGGNSANAHAHANGDSANAPGHARGNPASAGGHAGAGNNSAAPNSHSSRNSSATKPTRGPSGSPDRGKHPAGAKGKGAPHAAAPSPPPHKPSKPKATAPSTAPPASGTAASEPTPPTHGNSATATAAEPAGSP